MKKFFILGCPRSGTTMVQQALNRHSMIAIPPETKYFFSFLGHSKRQQARHVERLNSDLNIQLTLPEGGIRTDDSARAFYEELAVQYLNRLGKKPVAWFGEKTPEHTSHVARIRQLFPDSKILILYRDGRDVALSLSKAPWMPGGLYVSFLVWLYYQRIVQHVLERQLPNVYLAKYEDIVTDPEREFASILEFLEIPIEPAVALGWGNCEGIPQREYSWKANALEQISPKRVGAYRSELSEAQIAILERMGKRTLSSFGYRLETDGRNRLSPGFVWNLSCQMLMFVSELPWVAVARECVGQLYI